MFLYKGPAKVAKVLKYGRLVTALQYKYNHHAVGAVLLHVEAQWVREPDDKLFQRIAVREEVNGTVETFNNMFIEHVVAVSLESGNFSTTLSLGEDINLRRPSIVELLCREEPQERLITHESSNKLLRTKCGRILHITKGNAEIISVQPFV